MISNLDIDLCFSEEAPALDALGLEDGGADEVGAVLVALGAAVLVALGAALLVACGAADEEVSSWLTYLDN